MARVMILGATGAVGAHVLQRALASPHVSEVVAPTRRALTRRGLTPHEKLTNPIIHYETLTGQEEWWSVDGVVCCLGTTRRQAGSAEMFRRVDHDYVLKAARWAADAGCQAFVYNSSVGANVTAFMSLYLQTKGRVEGALQALEFQELVIVRPSLLSGADRPDTRLAEEAALMVDRHLGAFVPAKYRAVSVRHVAECLLAEALMAVERTQESGGSAPQVKVIENAEILKG